MRSWLANPGRFKVGNILGDHRAARTPAAGIVLLALCLTVYLPGLASIPPIDRDESRFAQASRQMVESGDYVVPRVQDRPRLNKPPLIYWLQSAAIWIVEGTPEQPAEAGDETIGGSDGSAAIAMPLIWPHRIPSVLCAIGTVLITWRLGRRMMDPRAAWLGAAFLAVSPMVMWDAHQGRADQLLLFSTTGAMSCLFVVWRRADRSPRSGFPAAAIGLWMFVGFGILAKGPITPMVVGLTALTLCLTTRRWRWVRSLRPVLGALIVSAMVAPWVFAIGERVGWSTYLATIYRETIGRSTDLGGAEGHWGPPGYHLVLLVVLMWPGSMLTGLGLRMAFGRASIRTQALTIGSSNRTQGVKRDGQGVSWWSRRLKFHASPWTFLLCWALPSWIVFELVSTKLPHYVMPLYPALCLVSARAVYAAETRRLIGLRDPLTRIGLWIWSVFALPLSAATLARVLGWRMGSYVSAAAWAIGGVLVTAIVLFEFIVPQVTGASTRVARMEQVINPSGNQPFAIVGYHEDSLIFLTAGRAQRLDHGALAAWVSANPEGIVAIELPLQDRTPENGREHGSEAGTTEFNAARVGLEPVTLPGGGPAELGGLLNYSKGKSITVRFFRAAPNQRTSE